MRRSWRWIRLALLVGGCSPPIRAGDTEAVSSSGSTAASTAGPAQPADPTTSTSLADDTNETGETTDGPAFVAMSDFSPPDTCNNWRDDCPRGMKCTFWASDGASWDATRCVPIAEDPAGVGEPCEVRDGAASGLDDCEPGAMCWNVEADSGVGHCIPLCIGSSQDPTCADPCRQCVIGGGPLAVCPQRCDPMLQDCRDGEGCYPAHGGSFVCTLDLSAGGGQAGSACEFVNSCEPGNACVDADLQPPGACEFGGSCCTPICDPTAIDPCPDGLAGVSCFPTYSADPAAHECGGPAEIGLCILPSR